MKYKILVGLIIVSMFIFGCTMQQETKEDMSDEKVEKMVEYEMEETSEKISYTDVSAEEAKQLIETTEDLVIIDVSPKYDEGHIPGAVNYYVGDGSLDEAIPSLDKEKIYLVYCHVDSASIAGAEKLIKAGFENVYRLKGNYKAWVNAGYDIEK